MDEKYDDEFFMPKEFNAVQPKTNGPIITVSPANCLKIKV
jgi:hypothetical protein